MGIFDEADYVEYELRPDLLNDTLFLYNSSSQLLRPRGPYTGGARVMWSNTNAGYKVPGIVNWGLTTTLPSGDIILTDNYDAYRQIIDKVNPGTWLSGNTISSPSGAAALQKCDANAKEMANRTIEHPDLDTVSLATDWSLPTPPPGLSALIQSGAQGKTGKMVDVTSTSIAFSIRDAKGSPVTGIALKPSASSARPQNSPPVASTGGPDASESPSALSTGAKAGIGTGIGVGVGALIGAGIGLFLRRRKRKQRAAKEGSGKGGGASDADENGYTKAELATGPGVEKEQPVEMEARVGGMPEVDGGDRKVWEVDGGGDEERKYEMLASNVEPVELPVNERAVEVDGAATAHNSEAREK